MHTHITVDMDICGC